MTCLFSTKGRAKSILFAGASFQPSLELCCVETDTATADLVRWDELPARPHTVESVAGDTQPGDDLLGR